MTANSSPGTDASLFVIREEASDDADCIDAVNRAAFLDHPFSQQTEHLIVRGLRESGALTLSLVATVQGAIVAHVAASPVTIDGHEANWCGLGPVSVMPYHQRRGIGSALVRSALRRLRDAGRGGCVVLGDPAYYRRLGFAPQPGLAYPGALPEHFMAVAWQGTAPDGLAAYHAAFAVRA